MRSWRPPPSDMADHGRSLDSTQLAENCQFETDTDGIKVVRAWCIEGDLPVYQSVQLSPDQIPAGDLLTDFRGAGNLDFRTDPGCSEPRLGLVDGSPPKLFVDPLVGVSLWFWS